MIVSKLDEAVKLGPALDALIRHKLKVLAWPTASACPRTGTACRRRRWCSARCARAGSRPGARRRRSEPGLRRPAPRPPRPLRRHACTPPSPSRTDLRMHDLDARPCSPPRAAGPGARPAPPVRRHAPRASCRWWPTRTWPSAAWCWSGCARALGAQGLHTLVVDAADSAPAPHELAALDLRCLHRGAVAAVSYLAARGLPLRYVDTRGSSARFLDRLLAGRAAGRRGAGARRCRRPGAAVRAPRRCARCCWPPTSPKPDPCLRRR